MPANLSPVPPVYLRFLEYTLLLLAVVGELLTQAANPLRDSFLFPVPVWLVLLLGGFTLLSLFTPRDQPLVLRCGYLLLGTLCVAGGCVVSGVRFFPLLFLLMVIKGCFLLDRWQALGYAVLTAVVFALCAAWRAQTILLSPQTIALLVNNGPVVAVVYMLVFLVGMFFVFLLSQSLLAEQRSRREAELLAEQVAAMATTLERTRIAREMHDALGHTLTSLNVQLEVAQKLRERNPEQALLALDTAKELAHQSLSDVRHALTALRAPGTDLQQALSALVAQVQHSLTVELSVQVPLLPLNMQHQLYCMVQECLTNTRKHAHATQVWIVVQHRAYRLYLEVRDNGNGFDATMPRGGLGLAGMCERVEGLGGTLKIQTAPGAGTRVQVEVPYDPATVGG
ncbi:sensor histidine kinase [Anthocerotibacter panamensis]|uniref:sensor histidine kinase n=1 Tax=Anthocerotibacter panamensis TaxID=2857077 RepID=UPI001C4040E6|nr:sensor histidine kinase [Anthocerotibacter panamensis]